MRESVDLFEYAGFLAARWLVIGMATLAAFLLALGGSVLQGKRYTAIASIVIEPPGSNDARMATAVSPIYLESLRTYERFAASDSLFEQAVARFKLQDAERSTSIEALKRRVLKVSKIRDTKILEISVTLPDPKVAQSLAEYLARETVAASHNANFTFDREFIDDADKLQTEAQSRLDKSRAAWTENIAREPVDTLRAQVEADTELLSKTRQELIAVESDVAEYQERGDVDYARQQLGASRAKAVSLQHRVGEMTRSLAEANATLARRSARAESLQMDLKAAQVAYDAAAVRARELRGSAGMRGERLRVIDPGIVPQRPSSPNIPLNVLTAIVAAFAGSIVYLSFKFALGGRVRQAAFR